jgi:hypothetical protein
MYRDFRIVVGSKGIGRTAQDGVQYLHTELGSPGAYAPGSTSAMEVRLITPPALIGTGPLMGVTSAGCPRAGMKI